MSFIDDLLSIRKKQDKIREAKQPSLVKRFKSFVSGPTPIQRAVKPAQDFLQKLGAKYPTQTEKAVGVIDPFLQKKAKPFIKEPYKPITLPEAKLIKKETPVYEKPGKAVSQYGYNYLVKPFIEGVVNAPRNISGGIYRIGYGLADVGEKKPGAYRELAGGVGQGVTGVMDITVGGAAKKVGKQALETAARNTLRKTVAEGALQGSKFGGIYGLMSGLDVESAQKDINEYLKGVGTATATGAGGGLILGGALSAVGYGFGKLLAAVGTALRKVNPKATPRDVQMATIKYVRDEAGRFAKQQFKAAADEPVYYGDIREQMGLPRNGDYIPSPGLSARASPGKYEELTKKPPVGRSKGVWDAMREVTSTAESEDDAVAKLSRFINDYTQFADKKQIADLKAALNKELNLISGGSGNYKQDYAMRKALRGESVMIEFLDNTVEDIDAGLYAARKGQPPVAGETGWKLSGDGTVLPSESTSAKEPSLPVAGREDPSGATMRTSQLSPVMSINQSWDSKRTNFLKRFDTLSPSKEEYTTYYREMKEQEGNFREFLQDVKDDLGGNLAYRLKTEESLGGKLRRKNQHPDKPRPLGSMNDTLAATIIVDKPEDVDRALKLGLMRGVDPDSIDDFRRTPTFLGYRAMHTNYKLPNGAIAELQINTKDGFIQKTYAHTIYDKWRQYIEANGDDTYEAVIGRIPKELKDDFKKDVQLSNDVYNGKVEVPVEFRQQAERKMREGEAFLKSGKSKVEATPEAVGSPTTAGTPPGGTKPPPKNSVADLIAGRRKLEAGEGEYSLKSLDVNEDVGELIERVAKENKDAIKEQRRGTITFEETRTAADAVGIDLKHVGPGKAVNAEQLVAAGDILKTQAEKTARLRSQRWDTAGTPEGVRVKLEYAESLSQMSAVMAKVFGLETETGRALNSIKVIRKALTDPSVENARKVYKLFKGEKNLTELITRYNDLVDSQGQQAGYDFLRSMQKQNFFDYFEWYWFNAILSGPRTHVRNMIGNTTALLLEPVERFGTAVAETVVAPLEGRKREVYFGEPVAELHGIQQGVTEGFRKFVYMMKNGYSLEDVTKLELARIKGPRGLLGKTIGAPLRFLAASDQFNRTLVFNMRIRAAAWREAAKSGKKGEEFAAVMGDLVKNPTEKMVSEAAGAAKNRTYQDEMSAFGHALKDLQKSIDIKGFRPITFILPFIQTPVNVAKFAAQRGAVTGTALSVIEAAAKKGPARSEAIARGMFASTTGAIIGMLAAQGKITGPGPSNKKDRDLLEEQGWKPYSFKIGNKWYSYRTMEPLSSILLQPALLWEMFKYDKKAPTEQQASKFLSELAKAYVDQPFLTGVADWLEAMTDPGTFGQRYIQKLAGSVIPNLITTAAQTIDPVARDPRGISEEVKSRLPFLSKEVKPRLNEFDTPKVYERSPGIMGVFETATPFSAVTEKEGAGQLRSDAETAQLFRDIEKRIVKGESVEGYPAELVQHLKAEELAVAAKNGDDLEAVVKRLGADKETVRKAIEMDTLFAQGLTRPDARMKLYPPGLKRAQMFLDRYDMFGTQETQNEYVTKMVDLGILDSDTLRYVKQILQTRKEKREAAGVP